MSIWWKGKSSGLDSVYRNLPSSWRHRSWLNLVNKVFSKRSAIEENPKAGWCIFGTASPQLAGNYTMAEIETRKSGVYVEIDAIISNEVGESYADYGVIKYQMFSVIRL